MFSNSGSMLRSSKPARTTKTVRSASFSMICVSATNSTGGQSINTTSLNLLQIVAEKHENASVLNYHELARYDTADRTRKVYDMFLDWLNADTGNTVFVFPVWDEEINDFNPSWNDQHKRQIPVV